MVKKILTKEDQVKTGLPVSDTLLPQITPDQADHLMELFKQNQAGLGDLLVLAHYLGQSSDSADNSSVTIEAVQDRINQFFADDDSVD